MKRALRLVALVAVLALVGTACKSEEEPAGGGDQAKPGEGTLACQVTDTGGIDDKSFNATAYKGLTDAKEQLGIDEKFLESQTQDDYAPNIQTLIDEGCDLIVTVGFLLGDATEAAAKDNRDQNFAIVDFAYDPQIDNVLGLTFATDQAAFLAGYLAAGMTQSGKIGTFGGINIPPVTIFMNGFAAGIAKYNEDNGTKVELLGWDAVKQDGTFTGDFENQDNGRHVAEDFISEGVDIVLPVAGPVGLGAAAAAQDAGDVMMIGVDTDQFVSAPEYADLWLTSIQKNMDVAVFTSIESVIDGTFEGGIYSGTLENEGVGIAPFHNLEGQVPQELADKVEELKAGIIDGSVSVDPADYE